MVGQQLHEIFGQARHLYRAPHATGVTDAQLIDRFVTRRDEAAFELLVWRYGPMVLGVCRRILHDSHGAEDAFQAVFLTLARKAGTIGRRQSVGSWLYTVAYRTALRARDRTVHRALHEQPLNGIEELNAIRKPEDELGLDELGSALDKALSNLPEKYRTVIVLCYLQGKTNEQAAEELGCPKGTVLSRLSRARERLRDRLTGHGVILSAGPFLVLLSQMASSLPEMSPVLVNATVQFAGLCAVGKTVAGLVASSVAELTEDAIKELSVRRLRYFVAMALLMVLIIGVGVSAGSVLAAQAARPTDPGHGAHALPPESGQPVVGPGDCWRETAMQPAR